jgi:hypothetical protein
VLATGAAARRDLAHERTEGIEVPAHPVPGQLAFPDSMAAAIPSCVRSTPALI